MVEGRRFEPNPGNVKGKLGWTQMKMKQDALKNPANLKIDPDNSTTGNLENHFICQICLAVVRDPKQCE